MNILAEVGTFAGRHPGFFAGIISLLLALVSSWFRRLLINTVMKAPTVVLRKTYLHRSLGDALIANLLKAGYTSKKFVGELYGEDPAFIKSEKEVKHILYRDFSSNMQLFYRKLWSIKDWLFISGQPLVYDKEKARHYEYVVYSFRFSGTLIPLLEVATDSKNEGDDGEDARPGFCVKRVSGERFFKEAKGDGGGNANKIDRNLEHVLKDPFSSLVPTRWEKNNIGVETFHNTLEMMSLNPELEDVLEEVDFWFKNRDFFEERGIAHRRGYLFTGPPGTGKSLFSRALAEKFDCPLIIFDLTSMSNTDLISAWSQILPGRIVLFEDIDAVFDGRTSLANPDLTFDCFLQCLSGADNKTGILHILSTNHPEKLDYAIGGGTKDEISGKKLPTRPGRCDRVVYFNSLDRAGRVKLCERILKDVSLAEKVVDEKESATLSAAQLQEKCFRLATEILFGARKPTTTSNGHNIPAPIDIPRA
jgi:hypothetical protein